MAVRLNIQVFPSLIGKIHRPSLAVKAPGWGGKGRPGRVEPQGVAASECFRLAYSSPPALHQPLNKVTPWGWKRLGPMTLSPGRLSPNTHPKVGAKVMADGLPLSQLSVPKEIAAHPQSPPRVHLPLAFQASWYYPPQQQQHRMEAQWGG